MKIKIITRILPSVLVVAVLLCTLSLSTKVASANDFKYSYAIKRVDGQWLEVTPHAALPAPDATSTLKIVIAELTLRSAKDLGEKQKVGKGHQYCGSNEGLGDKANLKEALVQALRDSNNTAANVLMDFGGGKDKLNYRADKRQYEGTAINNLYKCSGEGDNKTTSIDVALALDRLWNAKGDRYVVARNALREAARSNNYWWDSKPKYLLASKYGKTSTTYSNAAVVGSGSKKCVVAVFINKKKYGEETSKAYMKQITRKAQKLC